jgi:hypothetical protein
MHKNQVAKGIKSKKEANTVKAIKSEKTATKQSGPYYSKEPVKHAIVMSAAWTVLMWM